MTFLKTLFWVIVAVIVALLWQSSPRVDLPIGSEDADGLIINSRLGTWIILSFLVGFVPLYLYHRTIKWRLKRRVKTLEAQVETHNRTLTTQAEARTTSIGATSDGAHPTTHDTATATNAGFMPAPRATDEPAGATATKDKDGTI